MTGLYPIVRRVRRPLVAPELPLPEVKVETGNIESPFAKASVDGHPTSNTELRTGEPDETGTPNPNDEPIVAQPVE